MTNLGNNVHIFARPHGHEELRWFFATVLQCERVRTVEHPGMAEPMLVAHFPGGGNLSVEFISDASDDDDPRLGAWLELQAEDPGALRRTALDAGLREVKHPGHPYYFLRPESWSSRSRRRADCRCEGAIVQRRTIAAVAGSSRHDASDPAITLVSGLAEGEAEGV